MSEHQKSMKDKPSGSQKENRQHPTNTSEVAWAKLCLVLAALGGLFLVWAGFDSR